MGTPSFINGRPTLKAGRRIITVNKPKSTNKVLSMGVSNPLVNKAGDLISLNINVNKGTKNRGRPKKSATTMGEMSGEMSDMRETRDKSKRSADAMSETNGISPEKKKGRSERASDEKIGTVSKHINHITNKKKNKMCIDCKKMEVEGCWFCGKEEHVCEMALPKIQVDYEWLWVCMECHDIVTDNASLITLWEAVKNEKEKRKNKETETYPCGACPRLVCKNQRSIECIQCMVWVHQSCAGFKTHAEAKANKNTFKCKKCSEATDKEKIVLVYNGISVRKSDRISRTGEMVKRRA